jgi:hypothetical protein
MGVAKPDDNVVASVKIPLIEGDPSLPSLLLLLLSDRLRPSDTMSVPRKARRKVLHFRRRFNQCPID